MIVYFSRRSTEQQVINLALLECHGSVAEANHSESACAIIVEQYLTFSASGLLSSQPSGITHIT
jgi:hypothetical protein